jgi:hypothetical protein
MLGYGTASFVLLGTLVTRFDELAGRSGLNDVTPIAYRVTETAAPPDPFSPPVKSPN